MSEEPISEDAPKKVRPLVVQLEPGKHAICSCGQTAKAPFCDGSHRDTEFRPVIEKVADIARNIAWCTCEASAKTPYCDGSHRQFWDDPSKPPMKPEKD